MQHQYHIKVRGFHLDLYQHVNNARYLEFLEEARWDYLEQQPAMMAIAARGLAWVIVNINISYRHAATMGNDLLIHTTLSKAGGKSAVFKQQIRCQQTDKVVVDADITFVLVDQKSGKAVELSEEMMTVMQPLLVAE